MTHTAWLIPHESYDAYLTHIFRQFATNVSLYPLLWDDEINNGLSLSNLISLCSHENNDIAAAVIQTLYELVDQVNFGSGFPSPSSLSVQPGIQINLIFNIDIDIAVFENSILILILILQFLKIQYWYGYWYCSSNILRNILAIYCSINILLILKIFDKMDLEYTFW